MESILNEIDDEDEFFVFEDFILLNIDIIDFYFYDILFVVSLDSGDRINLKRKKKLFDFFLFYGLVMCYLFLKGIFV